MADISKVEVKEFENNGATGFAVVPESETKKVVIPSPPSVSIVPINPRKCVIYLGAEAATDALKEYCVDNKLVFVCPAIADAETMVGAYIWAKANASKINIKKDTISVKANAANMELATALADAIMDEDDDADLEAEEFSL